MASNFDNWSDEFFRSDIKEMTAKFQSHITEMIDFDTLTLETAKQMGVTLWATDEKVDEEIIRQCTTSYGQIL